MNRSSRWPGRPVGGLLLFLAIFVLSAPVGAAGQPVAARALQQDSRPEDRSQEAPRPDSLRPDGQGRTAAYIEFLGNGVLYSLNIDYRFGANLGVRAGFGYFPLGGYPFFSAPVTFYGLVGTEHSLELGAGVALYYIEATIVEGSKVRPTATIGYRYQPAEGYIFRIGFTPIFRPGGEEGRAVLPWGGLSIGKTF